MVGVHEFIVIILSNAFTALVTVWGFSLKMERRISLLEGKLDMLLKTLGVPK